MKLKRVLVANRGEIALRVIRTLRVLGLESVAVYSDADRNSLPARLADAAIGIGPPPAAASYLSAEAILGAARRSGADAIHPGYGFLSEREDFALAVEAAGLAFLGPTPENIARFGNKLASRGALREAGIPPVPGSDEALRSKKDLERVAAEVGFPLLLKAAAGGGGKGIRIVRQASDLAGSFAIARSEAQSSFGRGELIAERYLERARHVEVQILGDGDGGIRLFYERDCSTQRRLQKVLEETPSPAVTPAIRERLLLAAGSAMSRARYRSAGTLEFLLAEDGTLYFLEMNTRIQVEHPISEATTGCDMIAEQIAVAVGEKLPAWEGDLAASVVPCRGAAIELRVNAEDPQRDFRPVTGVVTSLHLPSGPGIRVDTALEVGATVTPFYDPLLAKVVAWGVDRRQASRRLEAALRETHLGGIVTTVPLGLAVLADTVFRQGRNHCQYLAERLKDPGFFPGTPPAEILPLAAAAAAWFEHERRLPRAPTTTRASETDGAAWRTRSQWGDEA